MIVTPLLVNEDGLSYVVLGTPINENMPELDDMMLNGHGLTLPLKLSSMGIGLTDYLSF